MPLVFFNHNSSKLSDPCF